VFFVSGACNLAPKLKNGSKTHRLGLVEQTDVAAVLDPLEVEVNIVEQLCDDHVRPRIHLCGLGFRVQGLWFRV
jgi:hypothetical protein